LGKGVKLGEIRVGKEFLDWGVCFFGGKRGIGEGLGVWRVFWRGLEGVFGGFGKEVVPGGF